MWTSQGPWGVDFSERRNQRDHQMTEPTAEQQEEWRQAELAEQERARRQAILDYWMELKLNREAEERAYWREMWQSLDPFNYGHWR